MGDWIKTFRDTGIASLDAGNVGQAITLSQTISTRVAEESTDGQIKDLGRRLTAIGGELRAKMRSGGPPPPPPTELGAAGPSLAAFRTPPPPESGLLRPGSESSLGTLVYNPSKAGSTSLEFPALRNRFAAPPPIREENANPFSPQAVAVASAAAAKNLELARGAPRRAEQAVAAALQKSAEAERAADQLLRSAETSAEARLGRVRQNAAAKAAVARAEAEATLKAEGEGRFGVRPRPRPRSERGGGNGSTNQLAPEERFGVRPRPPLPPRPEGGGGGGGGGPPETNQLAAETAARFGTRPKRGGARTRRAVRPTHKFTRRR